MLKHNICFERSHSKMSKQNILLYHVLRMFRAIFACSAWTLVQFFVDGALEHRRNTRYHLPSSTLSLENSCQACAVLNKNDPVCCWRHSVHQLGSRFHQFLIIGLPGGLSCSHGGPCADPCNLISTAILWLVLIV